MPILSKVGAVYAKLESVSGVPETIVTAGKADDDVATTTSFIQAIEPKYEIDFTKIDRNFASPSLSAKPHFVGRRLAKLSFQTEIFGTGVAALTTSATTQAQATPIWANLFQACAMTFANVATPAGRTYTPTTAAQKTVTLHCYYDGQLHKLYGAMGTFTITANAGGLATINWEFTGVYSPVVAQANPTDSIFAATIPPLVESCSFVVGATAASVFKFEAVTVNVNNTVIPRADGNSPLGFNSMYITGRDVSVTVNPEAVLETDHPFWADLAAGTLKAVSFQIGSTAGNKVLVSLPYCQGANLTYSDRDGLLVLDVEMRAVTNTAGGDNELSIKFV